jgi:hypothetical protein
LGRQGDDGEGEGEGDDDDDNSEWGDGGGNGRGGDETMRWVTMRKKGLTLYLTTTVVNNDKPDDGRNCWNDGKG